MPVSSVAPEVTEIGRLAQSLAGVVNASAVAVSDRAGSRQDVLFTSMSLGPLSASPQLPTGEHAVAPIDRGVALMWPAAFSGAFVRDSLLIPIHVHVGGHLIVTAPVGRRSAH
jgi:hypothetical protein